MQRGESPVAFSIFHSPSSQNSKKSVIENLKTKPSAIVPFLFNSRKSDCCIPACRCLDWECWSGRGCLSRIFHPGQEWKPGFSTSNMSTYRDTGLLFVQYSQLPSDFLKTEKNFLPVTAQGTKKTRQRKSGLYVNTQWHHKKCMYKEPALRACRLSNLPQMSRHLSQIDTCRPPGPGFSCLKTAALEISVRYLQVVLREKEQPARSLQRVSAQVPP